MSTTQSTYSSEKGRIIELDYSGKILSINGSQSSYDERYIDVVLSPENKLAVAGGTKEYSEYNSLLTIFHSVCDYGEYMVDETCYSCPAGTYIPYRSDSQSCLPCSIGTYQNLTGQGSCLGCEVGTYQNLTGQTQCVQCPANTYTLLTNSTSCEGSCFTYLLLFIAKIQAQCNNCPKGYYYYNSSILCTPCHSWCSVCNVTATNCTECKNLTGISSFYNAPDEYSCICNSGYYVNEDNECTECHMMCSKCYGGTQHQCTECATDFGITFDFHSCYCMEGYYYTGNSSSKCESCHSFCKTCSGSSTNCSSCINQKGIEFSSSDSLFGQCLCSAEGYYLTSEGECGKCHPLCLACTGNTTNVCSSCAPSLNAEFTSSNTCGCKNGYYYNSKDETCEKCNTLCSECTGPTNSECTKCVSEIAFLLNSTICVANCALYGAYYSANGICLECHSNCSQCYGPSKSQCYSCSDENNLLFNSECVETCPSHYFATSDNFCLKCNTNCLECFNGSKSGCYNCSGTNLVLYGSSCIESCPDNTYLSQNSICLDCVSPCEQCINSSVCKKCISGYFLVTDTVKCVSAENCPEGTYPRFFYSNL